VLTAGDGDKTVYGQYRDEVGNLTETSDTITLDTTAPGVTFAINGDAPLTNNPAVNLTMTGADAAEMQFSNDGAAWSGWTAYAASYDWVLSDGDGEKTVYGQFRDEAGNLTETSDTITLDTTAPDVPVLVLEPEFTVGDANTLSWGDIGADSYDVEASTDPGFGSVDQSSGWIAATEYTFTGLSDGQTYYYRVKARDELGNETAWSGAQSSTQDASAPTSSAGPLAVYQTDLTIEVPWSGSDASSGLASVELFVNDGSGWTSAGSTTETGSPVPFSYTAAGEGTYSFYTVATDQVGLVETAPGSADAVTTVDVTGPVGTLVINGGDELTNDPEVDLTLAVTDAQDMRFSNDGSTWSDWQAYAASITWTLAAGDGAQTVHGQFRDAAGNVTEASDAITLDTTGPAAQFVINGDADLTNDPNVVLTMTATDAVQMQFSNDGAAWSGWTAYAASLDWVLAAGEGVQTVYGQFRDEAGNVTEASDTITVDTTAPGVPVMTAEPTYTAGTSNTVSWTGTGAATYQAEAATDEGFTDIQATTGWLPSTFFEFQGLADAQIYHYRVKARDDLGNESGWSGAVASTQDATAPVSTAGPLDPFQGSATFEVPWTGADATSGLASVELFVNDGSGWASAGTSTAVDPPEPFSFTASGDGQYGFYLVAHDGAGNSEGAGGTAEVSTVVDLTAPTASLVINGDEETTSTTQVLLTSTAFDANGVTGMRFTNVEADWPGGPDAWLPFAENHEWILPDGDGLHTVYAEYRDQAGNVVAASDAITLDTTPPGMPALVAEPAFTAGTQNTVEWIDSGAAGYFLQMSGDADFGDILANTGWVTTLSFTFTDLLDGQTYHFRIKAQDELENETDWAEATFSTQDASPPVSAAAPLPAYHGGADITVEWTGEDAVSGLAQVELMVNDGTGWVSAGVTTEVDPPAAFVYTTAESGTYSFHTIGTDLTGNVEAAPAEADASTIVDFSAPVAASGLDAEPGHQSIALTWVNPEEDDLAEVEVWAALWTISGGVSAYPEYDDFADAPARPASRAAAEASEEWTLVASGDPATTTFLHTEGMDTRGIYYYEVFVRDLAGNYSAPAAQGCRATNYLLGDFNNDGAINVFDITTLGATYGTDDGEPYYNAMVDVGPTDDNSGSGIPLTDSAINFEDLTIVALNYDQGKAATRVAGSEQPALTWYQADETTWILGLTEPCSSLKALRLVGQLAEQVTLTIEPGAALTDEVPFFLENIDRHGLDAGFAVLGRDAVLPVSGEILKVTTSLEVDLSGVVIQARDAENKDLAFALGAEPLLVLPQAYRLASNYPNPFNPQTTIAFDLPEPQMVRLAVYDLKGRLVRELVSEAMDAGSHTIVWSGTDRSDRRVASGVYFYQIQAGPLKATKRMMLVK
jgi:hypothetical protein